MGNNFLFDIWFEKGRLARYRKQLRLRDNHIYNTTSNILFNKGWDYQNTIEENYDR